MSVFLHALALRNFRGIGAEWQLMPNFKQFNFFIGPNNAGKSTVLNFISRFVPPQFRHGGQTPAVTVDPLDPHSGRPGGQIEMAIGAPLAPVAESLKQSMRGNSPERVFEYLDKVIDAVSNQGLVWVGSNIPYGDQLDLRFAPTTEQIRGILHDSEWHQLWTQLTASSGGGLIEHWIPQTLDTIRRQVPSSYPGTRIIPAVRRIGRKDTEFNDYGGEGLIDRLMSLQSPDHTHQKDRKLFDQINGFLREVTGSPEARIEVPYNREHVLVHMDDRLLPLRSLGTGIEEVIMIASFCTISRDEIVCIEEPEIHLHPLLQRKLVRYLAQNTTNQYFIATHSASFIDTPGSAIFHVRLNEGLTTISEALLKKERHSICMDLGHRASDIVQANCVIWVEGPSDRVYLKHWIRALDDSLQEGLHYAIMFYGGRLLNHLSADDDEVTEFIGLRDLNRNLAIVIDSDRSSGHARINATKQRIVEQVREHGGIAWVTKGREIENYVAHGEVQSAVAIVHSKTYGRPLAGGQYDHALHFQRKTATDNSKESALSVTNVDKVKVARIVCESQADLSILDLRDRLQEIVELIRSANA